MPGEPNRLLDQPYPIKIYQNNLGKKDTAYYTALELALQSQADIVLFQEPYCPKNRATGGYIGLTHSAFDLITPLPAQSLELSIRPRVLTYVRKASNIEVNPRYDLAADPDLQILEVITSLEPFLIINIYNERERLGPENPEAPEIRQRLGEYTVNRLLQFIPITQPALIAGDFNLHHPWWNSTATQADTTKATLLVAWLERIKANIIIDQEVINELGGTYYRSNLVKTSIIDLAFTAGFREVQWSGWCYGEHTGSDHEAITYQATLLGRRVLENRGIPPYNTGKADWDLFNLALKSGERACIRDLEEAKESGDYDKIGLSLTRLIQQAALEAIPRKRPSERSKPWWSEDLTRLRKNQARAFRAWKREGSEQAKKAYKEAYNTYSKGIRTAKESHWVQYLEGLSGSEAFQIQRYTKNRANGKVPTIRYTVEGREILAKTTEEKAQAFLIALFPAPEITPESTPLSESARPNQPKNQWEWPALAEVEIQKAIATSNPKKAPGPDQLSFQILQKAHQAAPRAFYTAYKALFEAGHHPACWKESIGIILPKPNKPDYTIPKAYRVISLLNCLGKVLEKVYATRLAYLANTTDLLHPTQIGGRKQRSAIDAALLLLNEIQQARNSRKASSTVISTAAFLDIKGAFDHVDKARLLGIFRNLGLPEGLARWTEGFLTGRKTRLLVDGQLQQATEIAVGIPQGSPISPILFLIYVRSILAEKVSNSLTIYQLSYMDDFCLLVSSTVARKNCRALEQAIIGLFTKAGQQAVEFDPGKTELIHFHTKRLVITEGLELPGLTVKPKEVVRWLGIWLDSKLSFKAHVEKKVNSATLAFNNLQRIGNTQKGLNYKALRLLYTTCVSSIADYGSQLWYRGPKARLGQLIRPFQQLQNMASAKILGAFKGSPAKALEAEAGLPPPEIRFEKACITYGLRAALFQGSHPIKQAILQPVKDELADSEDSDQGLISYIKPETQLLSLANRLNGLARRKGWRAEKIQARWDPPWALGLQASVTISNSPKEKAVLEHQSLLNTLFSKESPFNKTLAVYTDGSQGLVNQPGQQAQLENAAGVCIIGPKGLVMARCWNLGPNVEVADAEVIAIIKALQLVQEASTQLDQLYVFSDSQAAIARVQGKASSYTLLAKTLFRAFKEAGTEVHLHWVPSHKGIYGNELADQLAKRGLKAQPDPRDLYVSISYLRRQIKASIQASWKATGLKGDFGKQYTQICRGQIPLGCKPLIPGLQRRHQSAYIQLKTGIGYLRAYQEVIGNTEDGRCSCRAGSRQTTEHLVLGCTKYRQERHRMAKALKGLPLNLHTLFCTTAGKKALAEFLVSTGICTAKWLQEGS